MKIKYQPPAKKCHKHGKVRCAVCAQNYGKTGLPKNEKQL
jgi:hypothetical protein